MRPNTCTNKSQRIRPAFLPVLLGCVVLSGCIAVPAAAIDGTTQVLVAPRCASGTVRMCSVGWPSRIKKNQRDYSCSCEPL